MKELLGLMKWKRIEGWSIIIHRLDSTARVWFGFDRSNDDVKGQRSRIEQRSDKPDADVLVEGGSGSEGVGFEVQDLRIIRTCSLTNSPSSTILHNHSCSTTR